MGGPPRVWLIGGPTASGKSALALALAERFGGEIVNADSMQLYRDLRVLTARPSAAEEARAPHHLFGIADAGEPWSVGRWLRAALPVVDRIIEAGGPAIVAGGTGLYFKALTQGLAETPAVPTATRDEAAARLAGVGEPAFRDQLRALDRASEAAIAPGDRQRLVRAYSVAVHTGRPLSDWRAETRSPLHASAWRGVVVEPPRPELYRRCDARFETMLQAGGIDEVRALAARGLDPELPAMKVLGVRELAAWLSGRLAREEATASAQRATRNFAKRQSTWFRNQTPEWPRVEPQDIDKVSRIFTN